MCSIQKMDSGDEAMNDSGLIDFLSGCSCVMPDETDELINCINMLKEIHFL